MKKLTLLLISLTTVIFINAQNVAINNDGTSAATSALLDVKSTTKGMLMPRVTTAQRTTIASPALGLLVFDTDTKTIWTFDGNSWKNLYTSGGGLVLPFSQTANVATSALQVTNQGTGAAIEGSSSAQFGIGMTAKATGEASWGLFASSTGAGSQSIRSYADNGTAFHGENNNAANTNTLVNLLNKGAGKTGSFQLSNNTSTSANVQIAGNHLGEQLLIYQTNAANSKPAVSVINTGSGMGMQANSSGDNGISGTTTAVSKSGVYGEAGTGSNGVYGFNNGTSGGVRGESINGTGMIAYSTNGIGISASSINALGVRGSSFGDHGVQGTTTAVSKSGVRGEGGTGSNGVHGVNTGTGVGVRGESNTGIGIIGYSTSGTGLYANSISGKALEVSGNVKISGGNTDPGNGKVLTSDASGNATWQTPMAPPKVAFKVSDVITLDGTTNIFTFAEYKRVQYKTVEYDISNSFQIYAGSEEGTAGTFKAPVGGIYHFDAAVNFLFGTTFDYRELNMELRVYRNGATSTLARTGSYINSVDNTLVSLSTDVKLYANDIVWIVVDQWNTISMPSPLVAGKENYFNGHLVFPL